MSWLRIDDGFAEHPKVDALSDRAFRLHVAALCYCARNLTDGLLTDKQVRIVGAMVCSGRPIRYVKELVSQGLWEPAGDGDGFQIRDYLEYNPTAEKVKNERKRNAERQARFRATNADGNDVSHAVTNAAPSPVPVPSPKEQNLSDQLPTVAHETELSWDLDSALESVADRVARQKELTGWGPVQELLDLLPDMDENSPAVIRSLLAGLPSYAALAVAHEVLSPPSELRKPTAYAVSLLQEMGVAGSARGRKLHVLGRTLEIEAERRTA